MFSILTFLGSSCNFDMFRRSIKLYAALPTPSFLSPWVYSPLSSVYWLWISWPKQTEFSFLIRIDSLVSCTVFLCYQLMWKILGMANFYSICKMLALDIECHSAWHLKHWMSISLDKWNNNFTWAKKPSTNLRKIVAEINPLEPFVKDG